MLCIFQYFIQLDWPQRRTTIETTDVLNSFQFELQSISLKSDHFPSPNWVSVYRRTETRREHSRDRLNICAAANSFHHLRSSSLSVFCLAVVKIKLFLFEFALRVNRNRWENGLNDDRNRWNTNINCQPFRTQNCECRETQRWRKKKNCRVKMIHKLCQQFKIQIQLYSQLPHRIFYCIVLWRKATIYFFAVSRSLVEFLFPSFSSRRLRTTSFASKCSLAISRIAHWKTNEDESHFK